MIRKANYKDIDILTEMAVKLFVDITVENIRDEMESILSTENSVCYIMFENNKHIGFIYCQLKYDYIEDVKAYPVGYLEGAFLEEEYRKNEYVIEFFKFFENWAKAIGCKEIASNCEVSDTVTLELLKLMGMQEEYRIVHFRKNL